MVYQGGSGGHGSGGQGEDGSLPGLERGKRQGERVARGQADDLLNLAQEVKVLAIHLGCIRTKILKI